MNWLEEAEKYRTQIIQDTIELIQIPSVKSKKTKDYPYGKNLYKILNLMENKCIKDGFVVKNYNHHAISSTLGNKGRKIGVMCHLDVVPVQKEKWKFSPFQGIVENNIIYGRGSNDNKGPTMALYYAVQIVKKHIEQWNNHLTIIFGCDEESGMHDIDYYLEHENQIPELGFVPDCTFPINYGEHGLLTIDLMFPTPPFIAEIHGGEHSHIMADNVEVYLNKIPSNFKQYFDFFLEERQLKGEILADRILIHGKSAHGSRPFEGENAIAATLSFLGALYHDERCISAGKCLNNWLGKPLGIQYKSMKTGELTVCSSKIFLKDRNIHCICDIRYPTDMVYNDLLKNIHENWNILVQDGTTKIIDNSFGHYTDPQTPFIKELEKIYRKISKDKTTPCKVSPGDTYARKIPNFVAYGPTTREHLKRKNIGQAHQADEGMDIDTLIMGTAIYANALWYLLVEMDSKKSS